MSDNPYAEHFPEEPEISDEEMHARAVKAHADMAAASRAKKEKRKSMREAAMRRIVREELRSLLLELVDGKYDGLLYQFISRVDGISRGRIRP